MSGLTIDELRRPAAGGMWVSPARLCVSAAGEVVACDSPAAVRLLVGEGGSIPVAEAERYGLVGMADAPAATPPEPVAPAASTEAEEKAQQPAEDKQIAPPENKRRGFRGPLACPHDGSVLVTGKNGVRNCPMGDYRWQG